MNNNYNNNNNEEEEEEDEELFYRYQQQMTLHINVIRGAVEAQDQCSKKFRDAMKARLDSMKALLDKQQRTMETQDNLRNELYQKSLLVQRLFQELHGSVENNAVVTAVWEMNDSGAP